MIAKFDKFKAALIALCDYMKNEEIKNSIQKAEHDIQQILKKLELDIESEVTNIYINSTDITTINNELPVYLRNIKIEITEKLHNEWT